MQRARNTRNARAQRPPSGGRLAGLAGAGLMAASLLLLPAVAQADLVETLRRVKQGVVAVGTYQTTRRPPAKLFATGFVVTDGTFVATNAHAVPRELDLENKESLAVFIRRGEAVERRSASLIAADEAHDVAILKIMGPALPALALGEDSKVEEGQTVAFTGFPIGAVLGLYPATHQGIVAAIVPIGNPQLSAQQLDIKMVRRLSAPYPVFQLDATAYPGNSGSPLYDPKSGQVVGLVSSVFVKTTKERVLQDPSGITYVIPIGHLQRLLRKHGLLE